MNTLAAFGGGPLLGVNGLAIVGHGSSNAIELQMQLKQLNLS